MAKQRVKALGLRTSSGGQTTYKIEGSREFSTLYGRFPLAQDVLTMWPAQDFEDTEPAVEQVMPFLQVWEIRSVLDNDPDSLRFTYDSAELEQIEDPPITDGGESAFVEVRSGLAVHDEKSGHLTRHDYPSPPAHGEFAASEYLALAYDRWRNCVRKREPLPSTAYFNYTIVEQLGGGSKKVDPATFKIDHAVLDTLSKSSSVSGDARSLRKIQCR